MPPVTISKAKSDLCRLIKMAEAGQEVVIARGKAPVAKLVPYRRKAGRRFFGRLRGQIAAPDSFFEALPSGEMNT